MKLSLTFKSAIAIACVAIVPAHANDGNLYKDIFAPNSSFIRVLAPGQSVASIDGSSVKEMSSGISAFVNVLPGDTAVAFTNASTSVSVEPNVHYTVLAIEDEQLIVQTDPIVSSPSKADVTFYNVSDMDGLELHVPAANASLFQDVAKASGHTIAIKAPLTLDFEVRKDGEVIARVEQVELHRKAGVTILLSGGEGSLSATATPNSYLK